MNVWLEASLGLSGLLRGSGEVLRSSGGKGVGGIRELGEGIGIGRREDRGR
jgi:hypothetical protein